MPISDEIIELEPIKKSKTKLIIMMAAMGVLLALAVTFLIMYVLKPNVEPDNGKVIEITSRPGLLFSDTDADGKPILTASVGSAYTVYADIAVDGDDVNTDVLWSVEPAGAVRIEDRNIVTEAEQALSDGGVIPRSGGTVRYYCTFVPSDTVASNTPVVLTARSAKDATVKTDIEFYIVKQGTENIAFRSMYHLQGGSDIKNIDDNLEELELPFYSGSGANNTYYIQLEQLGKYDVTTDTYSKLTIGDVDGDKTNFLKIESDNPSLVRIDGKSYNPQTLKDTFSFVINSTGAGTGGNVANISITANTVGDYSAELVKRLRIVVKTPSELGYADEIRIYSQPVPANFGKDYAGKPYGTIPRSDTHIVMPYDTTNAKIADHIVLLPLSIQYNSDGTRKDTSEWISKISISSSNSNILTPSGSGANISFTANRLAGVIKGRDGRVTGGDCYLTVRDVASGGDISSSIFVNIIAQNVSGTPAVKTADGREYTRTRIDADTQAVFISDTVGTAPDADNTLGVQYNLSAPSDTKTDELVSDKDYLTRDYSVSFPDGVSVTVGGTRLVSGARNKLTDLMTVTHNGDGKRFTGKLDLTVRFDKDIEKGEYTIIFTKHGTELGSISSSADKSWSVGVTFKVSPVVTVAEFVDDDAGTALVTERGVRAGAFVAEDATTANLYIQNRGAGVKFPFSLKQLVFGFGEDGVELNPTVVLTVSGGSSATVTAVDANGVASFTGRYASDTTLAGTAKISVRNAQNTDIGTLTVNIYVIDEIKEAKLYENGKLLDERIARDVSYNANNNSSMSVDVEQVAVFGAYRTSQSSAPAINDNYNVGSNVTLAYFNGNGYVDLEDSPRDNYIDFAYGADVIYSYDVSNRRLLMRTPVFQYSYNNDVDISRVRVTFTTAPYAYSGSTVSVSRVYNFIREADEFAVYSDADCANKLSGDYTVNQGETVNLYSSPIIKITDNDDRPFDVVAVNAKANSKTVAACGQSYFTIPDNLRDALQSNIGGELFEPNTSRYVRANFTAPTALDAENGDRYSVAVSKGDNGFTLVVKNQARKLVNGATFWKDENYTDALTELDFGKYNKTVAAPYTATVYIKLEYESYTAGVTHFTKFEDITIELPKSLEITTMQFKGEGMTCVLGADGRVAPNRQGAETGANIQVLRCELRLRSDARDTQSASIDVTNTINTLSTKKLPVKIGSGLKRIDFFDKDGNILFGSDSESEKKITFEFKNYDEIGSNEKLELFRVDFHTISEVDDSYSFIGYDASKLKASANLPSHTCIQVNSTLTGNDPTITFGITKANFFKLDNELVTLTFTDESGGGNKTFTFKFRITVKLEVYEVKLGGNVINITTTGKKLDGVQPPNLLGGEEDTVGYWSKSSVVSPIYNGNDENAQLAPSAVYLQFLSARVEIKTADGKYVRYGTDGATTDIVVVYNKTDGKMNGTFTVYAANNTAFKVDNLFLHVWYRGNCTNTDEADTLFESRIPITISTSSNGLRAVKGSLGDTQAASVVLSVKTKTDQFNFAVEPYNLGTGDVAGHEERANIVYALYLDAGRNTLIYSTALPNGDTSVIATVDASGVIRLVDPKNRNGHIYFRASYLDESSGETRVVDRDIEYKIEIKDVTITRGQYTFDGGTFTLYYGNISQYTQMSNLRQFFELSTDFPNAAVTGNAWNFTVAVESGGDDIIRVANGLNGAVGSLRAIGVGKTKITVDFVGRYGGTVSKTFDVNVVSLDAAIDITANGVPTIDILQNSAIDVTAAANTLRGIDVTVEFTTSGGLAVGTPTALATNNNRATRTAPVALDRKAYRNSSDYGDKTLTVRVTYTKKADAKSELISGSVVGPVSFTKTFTIKPVNSFANGFDFDLYRGATPIGASETIDGDATYSVKLNKIVTDADYSGAVSDGIQFNAAVTNNIINLSGSGRFASGSDTLGFTFGANTAGSVTVTVTAKVYGMQFAGISKTYTFTRGETATATMSHNASGGTGVYSPIAFTDGKATRAVDYDASGDNPNLFKYEIDASNVGVAVGVDDISIEYTGDVTVASPLASVGGGRFAIVFRAGSRSTKLIVSGSVNVNNKTYYTEKYELELTATEIAPTLSFTMQPGGNVNNVKPCDRLTFAIRNSATAFRGNYSVAYTVETGASYASFGTGASDRDILTVNSSVTEDVKLLVCATITVTGGAYSGNVYKLYNEITVHGVALPTVEWNAPVNSLGGNKMVDLNTLVEKDSNGNDSVSYAFAVNDADYGSSDCWIAANNVLTVEDTNKTRGGGRVRVKITATVNGTGINAGASVEAHAYIEWSAFTYGVTFGLDGGSIDGSTAAVATTQTYGGRYILPTAPTKTGYRFLGWFDGTTEITAETVVALSADKTLTAKWQAETYDVTFYLDGGNISGSTAAVATTQTYGGKYILPTAPTKTGYDFLGWFDGTAQVTANDNVTATPHTTLTAKWSAVEYTVTLNANGGTIATSTVSVTFDAAYELGTPTKTGYTFDGWYTAQADGTRVASLGTWITAGDVTLYAHWTVESYTVTLDANGGAHASGTDNTITVVYGGTHSALDGKDPTRDGYRFLGWFTAPVGGAQITAASNVTVNADNKLYAHWEQTVFNVTLNANGGTLAGDATITVNRGGKYSALDGKTPTRTGYVFGGWYTDPVGGTKVDKDTSFTLDADHTLYAQWVSTGNYIVSLDLKASDASCSIGSINVQGKTKYEGLPVPTRAGYTFGGWATRGDGSGKVANGSDIAFTGSFWNKVPTYKTLYATWTANKYTITLNADGGTGVPASVEVTYDAAYNLVSPTKTGYTFGGWYTDAACTAENRFASSGTVAITAHTALYAKWSQNTYTVTLDAMGGTIENVTVPVTYGAAYDLKEPTKTGYTFGGWFTDKACTAANSFATSGASSALTADTTLYAKWTVNTYDITLDVDGGTIANATVTVTYGAAYDLGIPTKTGHTFGGWYTDEACSTDKLFPTVGTTAITADVTLYAKWIVKTYVVTLDATGGVINSARMDIEYGHSYILGTPTRDGYRFDGWYDAKTGGTQFVTSGTYNVAEDKTLYARWTVESYDITFANSTQAGASYVFGATLPVPTQNGKIFVGWYMESTFATAVGNTVPDLGDYGDEVTLYAKWTDVIYTLTLDADGGTLFGQDSFAFNLKFNDTLALSAFVPEKAGHTFLGWKKSGESGYTSSVTVDTAFGDSLTLTAVWAKDITLAFDLDYETTEILDSIVTSVGASLTLPEPNERDGYTFDGWYTEKNGGGRRVTDGVLADLGTDAGATVTLYAKWTEEVPAP